MSLNILKLLAFTSPASTCWPFSLFLVLLGERFDWCHPPHSCYNVYTAVLKKERQECRHWLFTEVDNRNDFHEFGGNSRVATDFSRGSVETFFVSLFGFWICVQIVGLLIEFMYIGTVCKWCIFYDIQFFSFFSMKLWKVGLELTLSWKGQDQISMPNNNTCMMSCIFSSQYC